MERVRNDGGLGIFVRSLVGLDREAAKHAFDQFQCKRKLSANQIEFLNMVIDYLTERGVMDPRLLYEVLSPISMRWGWKVFSIMWVFLSLSVSWRRFGSVRLLDV